MVKSVKTDVYLTSDGEKFLNECEANNHETDLMIDTLFKILRPNWREEKQWKRGYRQALRDIIEKFGMPKGDISNFL